MLDVFIDRTGKTKGEVLENAMKGFAKHIPVGRFAKPEEIA